MQAAAEIAALERFVVDRKRRLLFAAGTPVPLPARAFDILLFLIDSRGREVSRDQIMAHVWNGRSVAGNNVTVQMSTLRLALAEHGGDGLIITIPGKGYRFIGTVAEAGGPETPSAPPPALPPGPALGPLGFRALFRSRPALLSIVGVIVLAAGLLGFAAANSAGWFADPAALLSVAVLPFRNLAGAGPASYMADAVTDDLTTELTHIPGGVVAARDDAERFREREARPSAIGRALGVRYLVDGSLRVTGNTVAINVALIDAASGRELWSQNFQTQADGLAATQTAIVSRVAGALQVELPVAVSDRSRRDRPDHPTAEDLFYRAYALILRNDTPDSFAQAQALLDQALKLRPNYGDALAELGMDLILKVQSDADSDFDADFARARQVIAQALATVQSPIALAASARLLQTQHDCAQAAPTALAALALDHDNIDALAVSAKCSVIFGRLDEAAADLRAILQLSDDPRRRKPRLALLTQALLLQGDFAGAIEAGNQALAGDPPPRPSPENLGRPEYVRLMIMAATALTGDLPAAQAMYAAYTPIWPHRSVWRIGADSPARLAALPGFARFLDGLQQAGMPRTADINAALAAPSAGEDTTADDFAPPPVVPPGVRTLNTAQLAAKLAAGGITVIDLGHGAAAIQGAVLGYVSTPAALEDLTQWLPAALRADCHAPIVTLADGVYGDAAPIAARVLAQHGCPQVYWYPGGEEAWAQAAMPAHDARPPY